MVLEYEIRGEIIVKYSKFNRHIYLVQDGNELAEVNLCDGVDLDYFLKEVQDEHSE